MTQAGWHAQFPYSLQHPSYVFIRAKAEEGDQMLIWLSQEVTKAYLNDELSQIDIQGNHPRVGISYNPFGDSFAGVITETNTSFKANAEDRAAGLPFDWVEDFYNPKENDKITVYKPETHNQKILTRAMANPIKGGFIRNAKTKTQNAIAKKLAKELSSREAGSRFIEMDDDQKSVPSVSVNEKFMESFTLNGGAEIDKEIGSLLVVGLTKRLSPIAFTSEIEKDLFHEYAMKSNEEISMRSRSTYAQLNDVDYVDEGNCDKSYFSNKSRVYIHLTEDGFRFLFVVAGRLLLASDHFNKSSELKPVQFSATHFVPLNKLNASYHVRWRGMDAELQATLDGIAGLHMALTQAINAVKPLFAELGDIDRTPIAFAYTKPIMPYGVIMTSPGLGIEEMERLDDEHQPWASDGYRYDAQRWKDGNSFGSWKMRSDGSQGWHHAVGRGYNSRRRKPCPRVPDLLRMILNHQGTSLLVSSGQEGRLQSDHCNWLQREIDMADETYDYQVEAVLREAFEDTRRTARVVDLD